MANRFHTAWPHYFRPAGAAGAPHLLLLHGTGGTEHDLVGLADRLAPGAGLLAPRGAVAEQGAARFFPRLAEGVFDEKEVAAHIHALAGFLGGAIRHYAPENPAGFVALGFSNGANAAAALLQLHPELPIRRAILLRPMVVLDQPAAPGSLQGRDVLLLNGARDPIVPTAHPPRLAALIGAGGARVGQAMHPDARHGLTPRDIELARDFLRRGEAA